MAKSWFAIQHLMHVNSSIQFSSSIYSLKFQWIEGTSHEINIFLLCFRSVQTSPFGFNLLLDGPENSGTSTEASGKRHQLGRGGMDSAASDVPAMFGYMGCKHQQDGDIV